MISNDNIESSVIHGIILYEDYHNRIFEIMDESCFDNEFARLIFKTCHQLFVKDKIISKEVVLDHFKHDEMLFNRVLTYITNLLPIDEEYLLDYCDILIDYSHRRRLYAIGQSSMLNSMNLGTEFIDIIAQTQNEVDDLAYKSTKAAAKDDDLDFFLNISDSDKVSRIYKTPFPKFDSQITITDNRLLLITGSQKDGKTRFVINIARYLMDTYPDVSVQWYCLEDSKKDLIATYSSTRVLSKPKNILAKKLSRNQQKIVKECAETWKTYDVDAYFNVSSTKSIASRFKTFCKSRRGRFNILIVDNIMALPEFAEMKNNQNGFYDSTMATFAQIKRDTGAFIIVLHHYRDSQAELKNVDEGFRPSLADIKGTEAFKSKPDYVVLMNYFGNKKSLFKEYDKKYHEVLKHLYIADIAVNRHDSVSGDEIIRYFVNHDYCIFKEIPI